MSWYSYRPHVTVAERRRKAAAAARKLAKDRVLAPIELPGRKIATTFWGKGWCDNLESYSDYANRLPRGRAYVRNGSVIDLQLRAGQIDALVQGSALYKVAIQISALEPPAWKAFKRRAAGKLTNLLDLLQGRLSPEILAEIAAPGTGLFPAPREIRLACSCPDWATLCKHVAAVLYGVGARLDTQPELFFTLRGVDLAELVSAASASVTEAAASAATDAGLGDANLSEVFGVEIETAPASTPPPAAVKPRSRAKAKTKAKPKAPPKAQAARRPLRRKAKKR